MQIKPIFVLLILLLSVVSSMAVTIYPDTDLLAGGFTLNSKATLDIPYIEIGDTWINTSWGNITFANNTVSQHNIIELNGEHNLGNYTTSITFDLYAPSDWTVSSLSMAVITANNNIDINTTPSYTQSGDFRQYIYTYNPNTLINSDMGYFDVNIWASAENTTWTYTGNRSWSNLFQVYDLDPAYNASSDYLTDTYRLNLTWDSGNHSDYDVLVRNNNSLPSSPSDGYIVQNLSSNSSNYFNDSDVLSTRYYTVFSYNTTTNSFSAGLNLNWGAVVMQCYDESNSTGLTFDVLITNEALETLNLQDLTNSHYLDMNNIPYGTNTLFYVSADNYESSTYYYNLVLNNFYNFTFYLPLAMPSGGVDDDDYDPENETYSHLYRFIVVNEIDQPLEGAKLHVMKYMNESDEWRDVSILLTDANGQADTYLLAGQGIIYKIQISKEGYITQTSDFIPDTDYYGAYYPKTFRLIREAIETPIIVTGFDIITWDAYFLSGDNNTLYVDYVDSTGNTTIGNIKIYQNGTILSYTYNFTSSSFNITWTNANHSMYGYKVMLSITSHPDITGGNFSDIQIIERYHTPDEDMFDFSWALEIDFVGVLGENPLGWVNVVVLFLGLLIIVSMGKQWIGLGIIGLGAVLFIVQRIIGLPGFTLIQLSVIPFFILYGFLVIVARNKKEVKI